MIFRGRITFKEYWGAIIFGVAVLLPGIPLSTTFSLRPEIILFLPVLAWNIGTYGFPFRPHYLNRWFLAIALSISFSLLFGMLALNVNVSTSDLFEILRVGLYALILSVPVISAGTAARTRTLIKLIIIIFAVSASVAVFQYFDVFGINGTITPLYTSSQLAGLLNYGRIVGTSANPNEYGLMMVLAILVCQATLYRTKSPKIRLLGGLALVLYTVAILFTSSRTAFVLAIFSSLYLMAMCMGRKRGKAKLKSIIVVIFIVALCVLVMLPLMTDYWKMRIGLLITPKDDASMNIKLEAWKSFITYWKQSPLLGWGPAKDTLGYSVDNEWLMLLSRYGIAGVIVFILFGFAIFRVLNRAAKRAAFPEIYGLNLALKAFIPAASIFMFVGGIYHNLQIMSVFLILIAWSTKQTKINVVHYDERKWGDPSVLCGNDSRGNISAN